jgi:cytoskeletal protein CcmA (bactofilin family)
MSDIFPEEQIVNSIIGPGSRFKGDINVHGLVRIDGDFSGSVKTRGKILIGQKGRMDGALAGRIVVIGGIVRGNIYADFKVIVLASAIVIGNINAPRVIVEEFGLIDGHLIISGTDPGVIRTDAIALTKGAGVGSENSKKELANTPKKWSLFGSKPVKR